MNPRVTKFKSALAALIIVILVAAPQAQQAMQPQFAPAAGAAPGGVREPAETPRPTSICWSAARPSSTSGRRSHGCR